MQFNYRNYHILLGLSLLLTACIEEYSPEIESEAGLLVVDGMIYNDLGPYTVRLSRAIDVYDYKNEYLPVEGASVQISQDNGRSANLWEIAPGVYQTDTLAIFGNTGRSYQLTILTPDGKFYASPFETIPARLPIDTIEAKVEYRYFNQEGRDIPGYQFYLSSVAAEKPDNYFLWLLESTHKYKADYPIYQIYEGRFEPFRPIDSLTTCWRTAVVDDIFVGNTLQYAQPKVTNFPLHFVRADTKELSIRYSLRVRQFTLNREAYDFWKRIVDLSREGGSLYTTQPYQIRGNVRAVADSTEVVLGYFTVAGVSEQRIFVNAPPVGLGPPRCGVDTIGDQFVSESSPAEWPIYLTTSTGGPALSGPGCLDCRQLGGTIFKPWFWRD